MTTQRDAGLDAASVSHGDGEELFVTVRPLAGEGLPGTFGRLGEALRERKAQPIKLTVFGAAGAFDAGMAALRGALGPKAGPVTWVDGAACDGGPVAGVQAQCLCGLRSEPLDLDGTTIGYTFADRWARYVVLGGLLPGELQADRPAQARQVLADIEAGLRAVRMSFRHVARTWLFVNNILDWYGPLNQARTRYFEERGVFTGVLPASTGIGTGNPAGAAMVAEAFAVHPTSPEIAVRAVPSPLQCSARDYGSSFSRALEVTTPVARRLFISGTASIAQGGGTAFVGDADCQVERTLEVVDALLGSRGMAWGDVTRAVAYFAHAEDAPSLDCALARQGLPRFPVVVARADVCRADLLFELEVDAARPADA